MKGGANLNAQIEDFMSDQVLGRRLDERTAKAYRLDLEHLYQWSQKQGIESMDEKTIENYLGYLVREKKLKYSTISRKYRVFGYYLKHLAVNGSIRGGYDVNCPISVKQENKRKDHKLSRLRVTSDMRRVDHIFGNVGRQSCFSENPIHI